jgi:3-oxoacyl-[acyl-carrier protein] reductase
MRGKLVSYTIVYVPPLPFRSIYAVGIVRDERNELHAVRIDSEHIPVLREQMEGEIVKMKTDFGEMEYFVPAFEKKEVKRVVLITGAGRGIGKATAIEFAKKGFNVIINDIELPDEGQEALNIIKELGQEAVFIKADVSKYDEVEKMVKEVIEKFGRIDVLVNNAGINIDRLLINMTPEQWQKVIDIDLTGVFNCTRAVIPYMISQGGGRIINVSSQSAFDGNIGQANYAAAKGGIISFTKVVAREYAQYNILCNAIAPGAIKTRLTEAIPPGQLKERIMRIPLGRRAEPEEVAKVIVFLATDATYITGEVIKVNAGEYL